MLFSQREEESGGMAGRWSLSLLPRDIDTGSRKQGGGGGRQVAGRELAVPAATGKGTVPLQGPNKGELLSDSCGCLYRPVRPSSK